MISAKKKSFINCFLLNQFRSEYSSSIGIIKLQYNNYYSYYNTYLIIIFNCQSYIPTPDNTSRTNLDIILQTIQKHYNLFIYSPICTIKRIFSTIQFQ